MHEDGHHGLLSVIVSKTAAAHKRRRTILLLMIVFVISGTCVGARMIQRKSSGRSRSLQEAHFELWQLLLLATQKDPGQQLWDQSVSAGSTTSGTIDLGVSSSYVINIAVSSTGVPPDLYLRCALPNTAMEIMEPNRGRPEIGAALYNATERKWLWWCAGRLHVTGDVMHVRQDYWHWDGRGWYHMRNL